MRFLKNIVGFALLGALLGCIGIEEPNVPRIGEERDVVDVIRTDEEYYRKKIKNLEEKLRRLSQYDDKKKDSRGECEGDRDCEEICDDIFDRRRDREDCEELSIATVERFDEVYKLLEDPDEDDLPDINPEDLSALISISIEPLDDLVGGYSSREAKEVAIWIAENSDIAEVFESEDDDFKLFEAIFKEIGSTATNGLERSLTSGDNFVEILVQDGNDEALEWVHNYFADEGGEGECNGADDDELCVLSRWCALDFDRTTEEDLLDMESFEDFLTDLIDEASEGDFEAHGDLEVCPITEEYLEEISASGHKCSYDEFTESSSNNCEEQEGDSDVTDCSGLSGYWGDIEDANDLDDDWTNQLCK